MRRIIAVLLMFALCAAMPFCFAETEIPEFTLKTDFEIPDTEAMTFVKNMGVGWNLGNTFDASDCNWITRELEYERAWNGAMTTEADIIALKEAGFSTIRIPISWHNHVSGDDFVISEPWLNRVQEVVDWAIGQDMYVIINTHHDMDKNYCYPDSEHYELSERYIVSIWSQLAERFKDYDEHLIFESMNEPRLKDTGFEWNFSKIQPDCKDAADCINRLNQAFVNTVRASGGNNANRYLMVPGYAASPANVMNELFVIPEDTADHKIIISVHAYTPYDFALAAGGKTTFSPANTNQTGEIGSFMNQLYGRYVKYGTPVVIGEYGARDKGNLQDRVNFAAYYVASAHVRGMACCWWDNGAMSGSGEVFGILKRLTAQWVYPEIVDAIMYGAHYGE